MSKVLTNVLYRYEGSIENISFEHIIAYRNGFILSDNYEGYPTLSKEEIIQFLNEIGVSVVNVGLIIRNLNSTKEILQALADKGLINLDVEKIREEGM